MDLNDGETPAAAATFNGFNDASDPFSPDGVKTTSAVRPAIDRQVKLREVAERALAAMDVELEVDSDIEFNIPPIASRLKAECDERRFALAESDHRRDRTVLFDYDVLPRLEPETEPSLGDGESVFDASDSFVVGEEPF